MKKILVVDDEEILRMLILDTLEDLGYEVEEAEDGQEALEKVEQLEYDLMILDYMMPNVTGIEVIERLPDSIKAKLPVLMLTAKAQVADRQEVLDKGADYFMAKPFSPSDLESVVKEILNG
ncbi:CheY-like chemotaxis protein [Bacillus ectoiniformans]|uniref:response regulator transcription factor n=1 Tax=Bacillus ectoiniformans TaxID=1494429 RepID=UPI0019593E86|nr:response regulator transcription factor [Bacillus ectoiniformans]MBM7648727.1 CheY-like chemotaxis protein [Bacillus ectoiniformans]